MKLKQIQIQGFKSFANRTVLNFDDNITLVVGPNGCGKSNLVDAIRWAMGEQSAKHLRGENMADVIFHGAEDAQGVGMAEVVMTFDNSDGTAPPELAKFSEIQVARRLFANGDSEYYMNKTACRLKDITDLFLGSGAGTKAYSIIEQGRIESIITMKADQRRSLIEEAAGVSKYRIRKNEAERKMDSTRQNLLRIRDIIAELSRQMNSLNRQAKKAERYKQAKEELKVLEIELMALRGREIRRDRAAAEEGIAALRESELAMATAMETAQAELEKVKAQLAELESARNELRGRLSEASRAVEREENALLMLQQERRTLSDNLTRIDAERNELKARSESIEREDGELAADIVKIEAGLAAEQECLARVEEEKAAKENDFRRIIDEAGALEKKVSAARMALEKIKERLEWASRRADDLARGRESVKTRLADLSSSLESKARSNLSYNEKLYTLRKEIQELRERIEEDEKTLEDARSRRSEVSGRLQEKEKNHQRLSSRLESLREMERNLEGYQRGVKSIMERKRSREAEGLNGIHGLITDAIRVAPDYELALEAVLGDRLQSIVVTDRTSGLDNIKFLQNQKAGRSSFVPMSGTSAMAVEVPPALSQMGAVPLADVVEVDETHRPLVRALIGPALVVDDIERAAVARDEVHATNPLVTRDGILFDEYGVLMGGSTDSFSGFLAKKREMDELENQIAVLDQERGETRAELTEVERTIGEGQQRLSELKERFHRREIERNNVDKDLRQGTEVYNQIKSEMTRLEEEEKHAEETIAALDAETHENRAQLEAEFAAAEAAEKERAEISIALNQLRAEREAVVERCTAVQVKAAALQEKLLAQRRHRERMVKAREEVEAGLSRRTHEEAALKSRAENLATDVASAGERRDKAAAVAKGLADEARNKDAEFEAFAQEIRGQETSIKAFYRDRDALKSRIMEAEVALSELKMKWESLEENSRDKFARDLTEIIAETPEPDSEHFPIGEKLAAREELKEKIERMGEVNLTAIEEFEEISQRHSFLANQEADLIQALENLELTIAKINSAYRRSFKKTFDEVNEKFQEVFPKLFNGGKASLELTNPDDMLDTGVEILAQPPGKKMNYIALLSGGEKALTASALILALYQVRPSPFCLLDEVDAALDDINVSRFNERIQELSASSQLIIITHNRKTMQIADAIYGVTMEQKGVSKIVSVRFKQDGNGARPENETATNP